MTATGRAADFIIIDDPAPSRRYSPAEAARIADECVPGVELPAWVGDAWVWHRPRLASHGARVPVPIDVYAEAVALAARDRVIQLWGRRFVTNRWRR